MLSILFVHLHKYKYLIAIGLWWFDGDTGNGFMLHVSVKCQAGYFKLCVRLCLKQDNWLKIADSFLIHGGELYEYLNLAGNPFVSQVEEHVIDPSCTLSGLHQPRC